MPDGPVLGSSVSMARAPVKRCAVYTRKSSEEGLDQDFNSLDAQREACAAYIKSQIGEGWKPVRGQYDDGGLSGGTMDRPALQSLLQDIRDRKVDIVVVYKVDRLTRSLSDFARIVDVFDEHSVSFVSVTQQFNTTTSMGRLTLNMLLSFAQFEREVTGERIRDKIAASKKKGMWMGGTIPLGYEPDGRTLKINDAEAETIRTLFRLYLEYGNVRAVKAEADRLGLVTKVRIGNDGILRGGKPLSRGNIYKLLGNPLYIGRIPHKGESYDGLHPEIIDRDTWDRVQAGLAGAGRVRSGTKTSPSPLAGKLFDAGGEPLTPSHANKAGRRYRYYVSRSLVTGERMPTGTSDRGWRLPAVEIERFVAETVGGLISDTSTLTRLLRVHDVAADRIPALLQASGDWATKPLDHLHRMTLGDNEAWLEMDFPDKAGASTIRIEHKVRLRIRRRGVETKLVIKDDVGTLTGEIDATLVRVLAKAHLWHEALAKGEYPSMDALANAEGVTRRYVGQVLPLASLAPDIVEAVLAGRQPVDLTVEKLVKHIEIPLNWVEQRSVLRFRPAS